MHGHGQARSSIAYDMTVAVIGNPNVGKSTLFNAVTGELSHVSNWPGTTVALKEGFKEWRGARIRFVDLPGVYGLGATSLEEVVAREYLVSGDADLVLVLADSTVPERTLYLPLQVLELTPSVIIVFTKVDEMDRRGVHINFGKLASILGVPVVPVSAIKNIGLRELLDTIVSCVHGPKTRAEVLRIDYGNLEPFIEEVSRLVGGSEVLRGYSARWLAIRLLEGDPRLEELLIAHGEMSTLRAVQSVKEAIRRSVGRDPAELIINARFEFVTSLVREVVVRVRGLAARKGFLEVLGSIVQNPVVGPAVSLGVLFPLFSMVFTVNTGFPLNLILRAIGLPWLADAIEAYSLSSAIGRLFNALSDMVRSLIHNEVVASLIADGVVVGVGAMITFLPLIFLAFVLIAALEDSGLAPRMAVGFHNLFSVFGLSGRAVYPLLLGLGCNVPAIMASRTSIDEIERREIIAAAPFIPCQARLVVTMAFVTAYLSSPLAQALVLLGVYVAGIAYYLVTSMIIRRLVYGVSEAPELVLELPLMHVPKLRVIWWISWEYTRHFLRKAGLIILMLSVVIWSALTLGPSGPAADVRESFLGLIGRSLSPILAPIGVPDETSWRIAASLVQGFVAKEAILETIAILEGTADVSEAIASLDLTLPQVLALLVFINSYVPCAATFAVVYQETKSLKRTVVLAAYMVTLAYGLSLVTYLLARALT